MTLHRDIYWLGRQWAVTGYGLQTVDRKSEGRYDIDMSRVWEDTLAAPMQSLDWFDADDFAAALIAARRCASNDVTPYRPPAGGEK